MKLNRSIVRKLIIESLQKLNENENLEDEDFVSDIKSKSNKEKIAAIQGLIDGQLDVGLEADGVWGKNTDKAWARWLEVKQKDMPEGIDIEKAGTDWKNNHGSFEPNINGILDFINKIMNNELRRADLMAQKKESEAVKARQSLLTSINNSIDKLSDKELKSKFNDKRSKAKSTEELKAIQKEVEAAVAKQNKANQAKLMRANKLKGWDSSSPPGGSAGNLDIADYEITKVTYGQSKTAKKLDVGFDDVLKVSFMPRPSATKAKIFMSMAPQGEDSAYYTYFWKTKKLEPGNLGVYLGELEGGFKLTIPRGIVKLDSLINTSMKDKVIYKSGSRSLSGADVAWLAIKLYGNDEKISNGFKKYAAESAGGGDSRKVGAKDVKKESKKLNSKLLRRLILKTLKEHGEV